MAARYYGEIWMAMLGLVPPMIVLSAYHFEWSAITTWSLSTKTILGALYVYLIVYKAVYGFFFSPLRHIPKPEDPHFVLGHVRRLWQRPPGQTPLHWMKTVPNDGLIVFRGFFHINESLLVTKPETVMEILNRNSYDWEKPGPARKFLARVLGNGLVNVEGNEHKWQRKNVTPAFSGRHIKDLVPIFWEKSFSLVDAIQREADANQGVVEIPELVSRATLDLIGSAGIGKDFLTTENSEHELARNYALITDPKKGSMLLYFVINSILPQWIVRRLPMKANARIAEATFALRRIVKELLAEKDQAMAEKTVEQKDIIATLMRSGKFTDDQLTDQLLTFLAAGHETTASALTWTSFLLSKNPSVQNRLRAELREHLGNLGPNASITAEAIDALPYLEAVCSEVLRFYPTVPATARRSNKATFIGTTRIPKGTFVIICPWAINRLPELWGADAEQFRPERWLESDGRTPRKNGGAVSPYAFITFLHGPRSCIGQSFARYEMKCLLASTILKFELSLRDVGYEPRPEGAVTIRPKEGMPIRVRALAQVDEKVE